MRTLTRLPRVPIERGEAVLCGANRYPGDEVTELVRALQDHHGLYHFVTGVGMDGVIETVLRVFVTAGDRIAISTPTFSFYGIAAIGQGADIITIPRKSDFSVDTGRFVRESGDAKVSFLCSPNNPTGTVTLCRRLQRYWKGYPAFSSSTMHTWSSAARITAPS